jgi:hypothetical protein
MLSGHAPGVAAARGRTLGAPARRSARTAPRAPRCAAFSAAQQVSYYEVLGVPPDATLEQIKARYRHLAKVGGSRSFPARQLHAVCAASPAAAAQ